MSFRVGFPRFATGRTVVGALVALLVLTIGVAFVVVRTGDTRNAEDAAAMRSLIERVGPGMCAMQEKLALNDRGGAFNVFYDEVHTGAHALAAELVKEDWSGAEEFVRAKSLVESDLRTLAPTLRKSVDDFSVHVHRALDEYDKGMWKPC